MPIWNELPFLVQIGILALLVSTLNYWFWYKRGYTAITNYILGFGIFFALIYKVMTLFG
jgi:uncharacterized membrane protein